MAKTLELIHPFYHRGERVASVTVRAPGPIRFAKYWWSDRSLPPHRFNVPLAAVDALHPADHSRLIAAMTQQTRIYGWLIGIGRYISNRGAAAPSQ